MATRSDIKGITEAGATAQTIALANVLYRDPAARDAVRKLLDLANLQCSHSGQDTDTKAAIATVLAGIMRRYNGPEIN